MSKQKFTAIFSDGTEKTARSIASHRENFNGYGKCSIEVVEVQS